MLFHRWKIPNDVRIFRPRQDKRGAISTRVRRARRRRERERYTVGYRLLSRSSEDQSTSLQKIFKARRRLLTCLHFSYAHVRVRILYYFARLAESTYGPLARPLVVVGNERIRIPDVPSSCHIDDVYQHTAFKNRLKTYLYELPKIYCSRQRFLVVRANEVKKKKEKLEQAKAGGRASKRASKRASERLSETLCRQRQTTKKSRCCEKE